MSTFIEEIDAQPDVIIETANAIYGQIESLRPLLVRLRSGNLRRVIFTGMGGSISGVYPSLMRLTAKGVDARVVEASELLYYQGQLLNAETLLVITSQSGRSVEIPAVLEMAQKAGTPVLGVTNTEGSPLHQNSQVVLLMKAGEEATVSTKTYTCTLAALHLLTTALLNEDCVAAFADIRFAAEAIRSNLATWRDHIKTLGNAWADTRFVEFLARGSSFASAATSALIFKESVKLPTEAMNAGQFRHGPLEVVDQRFTGVLFMGDSATHELNAALARDIAGYGGRLALVSRVDMALAGIHWIPLPAVHPALLPLVEIVPIQLFCGEMAVRQGYQAGQFRYITKVTTHE
jgi:glucosamine--fructose-6-phosphate aminotransferase (isomerizing)